MPVASGKLRGGFSLVEIILSLLLVAAILIVLLTSSGTLNTVYKSNLEGTAAKLATKQMESLKKNGFDTCCGENGTAALTDPKIAQDLPQGTGTRTVADYHAGDPDIKLVSVVIEWKYNNVDKSIKLESVIARNGI